MFFHNAPLSFSIIDRRSAYISVFMQRPELIGKKCLNITLKDVASVPTHPFVNVFNCKTLRVFTFSDQLLEQCYAASD